MESERNSPINSLKVFVGNLPFSVSPDDLKRLFSVYGDVQGINIRKDRNTGAPKGFAFVTFTSDDSAQEAIKSLHGQAYQGRTLTVNFADNRGSNVESRSSERQDQSWKTVPTPRKGSNNSKTSESRKKTWDNWAGPTSK